MFDSEFNECITDDILQKHKGILKILSMDSRVMCVCKDNERNEFYLQECCDDYFTHTLSRVECVELSEMFKEIADKI